MTFSYVLNFSKKEAKNHSSHTSASLNFFLFLDFN